MTTTTKGVWTVPIATITIDALYAKIDSMVAAGQTDGTKVGIKNSPVNGELTVDRTWVDTAAAQEWIDFVQPYGPLLYEIVV